MAIFAPLFALMSYFKAVDKRPNALVCGLFFGFFYGLSFDFSFESDWRYLAPVFNAFSLAGFLYFLPYLTRASARYFGFAFALGGFLWGLNWVYISMANFGNAPLFFALLANWGVVAYLALYSLLACYLTVLIGKTANQRRFLFAPIWALFEYLRSILFLGFPWLSVGYAWIDTPVSVLAAYGGVFLVSFFVLLFLGTLFLRLSLWLKLGLILSYLAVLAGLYFYAKRPVEQTSSTRVALVQGNMPVITEYNDERMMANITQYLTLSEKALSLPEVAKQKIDVLIWPEAAIPYFYSDIPLISKQLYEAGRVYQFDLISGVARADLASRDIYNAVVLQKHSDPSQDLNPEFYFKHHLLPFGEYLPLRPLFFFFKDFVSIPMSDFSSGALIQPPFVAGGLVFSPSICFEAVFGDEIRQNSQNTDVLLNLSNDAWFGKSKAQVQHLNIARMRAIENHKMLVRATNDGITAIVDTDGKVLKALPSFEEGILISDVYAKREPTLYSKTGDRFWAALFLAYLLVLTLFFKLRKSSHSF